MTGGYGRAARLLKTVLIGREATLPSLALRGSGAVAAVAFGASLAGQGAAQPAPAAAPAGRVVWLDQNWTDEQRRQYHNQSQGTLTLPIPVTWFLALQQPGGPSAGLFSDPAYMDTFGFLPSPKSAENPLGLPVGFAVTKGTDPRTGEQLDGVGFTCAACHTARLDHQGTTMLVDGGPAMIDLEAFGTKLALALGETDIIPTRFNRFAKRVLGENSSIGDRLRLRRQVGAVVRAGLGEALQGIGKKGVKEGPGRLDALNRIGNTVFGTGMGIHENYAATTAPVAFPHIWDTHWFTWVQYNGSIMQPMVRNAGEAMGVGARVNYIPGPGQFTSTIPIGTLYKPIEALLRGERAPQPDKRFSGLRSPQWPEKILGPINRGLAARGEALYQDRCQGCHLPSPRSDAFWTSNKWVPGNDPNERYLDVNLIPIATIGTDPAQAQDMLNRKVLVLPGVGLTKPVGKKGKYLVYEYGPALGQAVEKVVTRWYDANNVPQGDRDRMNGRRQNLIQAPMKYKARPLNGIWATPPYLHNGSVPTLWHLLSPYRERPTKFKLGSHTFDPRNVGYANAGSFELDTSKAGNRNTGHLFEAAGTGNPGRIGNELTPEERLALIEFLKTL